MSSGGAGLLILASNSPRRKALLSQLGVDFIVKPSGVEESPFPGETPEDFARRAARAKAVAIAEFHPDDWVVGADTIVILNGRILGKPRNADEAKEMLSALSGKRHTVITAFCVINRKRKTEICRTVSTDVWIKKLDMKEIERYIATGEPFDKAGAYAAQGIGSFMIKSINGSYTNVVGLPLCELVEVLKTVNAAEGVI